MDSDKYRIAVCSDRGLVCGQNEDNGFLYSDTVNSRDNGTLSVKAPFLVGVCDGMGGEACGGAVSGIAAAYAGMLFEELRRASGADEINSAVEKYVEAANSRIIERLDECSEGRGGTTFVFAYVEEGGRVYSFSLGDSRLYAYQASALRQVSSDHTVAMRKYRMNLCTREEAEKSPDSHKLTLFLGADTQRMGMKPEIYPPFTIEKGERIMLCSDGIYDMCGFQQIEGIISSEEGDKARKLVMSALNNGGIDNATCIVVEPE
ncbi:MAG: PP2C family protein-serine/threonine phosphatase [Ruminiclostridium sp.]